MKVVILAGGQGTRLAEETGVRPKPMVEIGGKPILWHIMKLYSHYGFNDFIICLGYKGYMIKEYFSNFFLHHSDVTFDFRNQKTTIHQQHVEPWSVTLVDTGEFTGTGGRLKQVEPYLDNETFCFTYGDGLCNVDLGDLMKFHKTHGKLATLTAINPPGRFGAVSIDSKGSVERFQEKAEGDDSWINGGFFVLEPKVINLISDASTGWESEPVEELARTGNLRAYKHSGFWQAMDTLREKSLLERMWQSGDAPWKVW